MKNRHDIAAIAAVVLLVSFGRAVTDVLIEYPESISLWKAIIHGAWDFGLGLWLGSLRVRR